LNVVLEKAKKLSIPSEKLQRQNSSIAKTAFDLVKKEIPKYSEIAAIEFGGSYAKGTWLPTKADVDIFVKFTSSTPTKRFIELAKKIGFDALKKYHPYVRYSEHPYVEAKIGKTKVNVVPCYDVKKGNWKSAADRSPYHTKFMLESLTDPMKNEVRLLKNFLISTRIYGSEIANQGVSGYVTEVLVLNYGSFLEVLRTIASLRENQVIGKPSKKFDTPVVIIDPIDSNRNLAAAISVENIGKFVLASRAFLNKPSISFFRKKPISSISKKNLDNVVVIKFNFKKRSPDIIWGQLKRAANSLSIQLEVEGFKVLRNSVTTDEKNKAWLLFLMQTQKIEYNYVHKGPDFLSRKDSESFIMKNVKKSRLMWIDKSRKILSLQKRKHSTATLFLQDLLKNNLNKSGIPKGLKDDLKKGFRVTVARQETTKSIKSALAELVLIDASIFSSH
jgi:tRNA nucleotidyltransferase (CCA-adding enzyme)